MSDQEKKPGNGLGSTEQPLSQPAHSLTYEAVCNELKVDGEEGLTSADAKKRLDLYGKNELEGGEGVSMAKIIIRQIANAMMLVCPCPLRSLHSVAR